MSIPAWNYDSSVSLPIIKTNIVDLIATIIQQAIIRKSPSAALAQQWHREIYQGVNLPCPYYAGEFRDSDPQFPYLIDYEVAVGVHAGIPAADVPKEVSIFERKLFKAIMQLDAIILPGQGPVTNGQLGSILMLSAYTHGEWVRIHPFANGNGRIGRSWIAWILARYSMPQFIRIHPRPQGDKYADAAQASMQGNHQPMVAALHEMLSKHVALQ
jgi:Fic family protein